MATEITVLHHWSKESMFVKGSWELPTFHCLDLINHLPPEKMLFSSTLCKTVDCLEDDKTKARTEYSVKLAKASLVYQNG